MESSTFHRFVQSRIPYYLQKNLASVVAVAVAAAGMSSLRRGPLPRLALVAAGSGALDVSFQSVAELGWAAMSFVALVKFGIFALAIGGYYLQSFVACPC